MRLFRSGSGNETDAIPASNLNGTGTHWLEAVAPLRLDPMSYLRQEIFIIETWVFSKGNNRG